MPLTIYVGEVDARGFFKTRNKTTRQIEKTYFDALLTDPNHPLLRRIAKIKPDYDFDPYYSLLSLAARKVLGPISEDEVEEAFDYLCDVLLDRDKTIGHRRFLKNTFMTLNPGTTKNVFLTMLGGTT